MIVAKDDDIADVIRAIKTEWPFSGRRESYAVGFKMAAFPLDHNLRIHPRAVEMAKKENKNIVMSMHADYQHSRVKVSEGGGAVYKKFMASVGSCSLPIITKDGKKTNLREMVTSFLDPSGKPRIANMSPMPASEDAGSVYTNFTSHRASSAKLTREIARCTEQFIQHEMAAEIWNLLPEEEAKKVLASSICGRLAMAESVTLEDVAESKPLFDIAEVEDTIKLDENSYHSEYITSLISSGITMGTERRIQSL